MIIDTPKTHHIPALRRLWKQAFDDEDAFLDKFFTLGFSKARCRCIFEKDQPVAALYWFDCTWDGKKIAYLYGVATDKDHQGQGLCRRLMNDTHQHLRSLGYRGTVLVPGSDSLFAFYSKMGYLPCSPVRRFSCEADAPVTLQKISASEYTALRKAYLPQGSVLQENVFPFLAAFADFYKGEDFLLCGSISDGVFHSQELLGNSRAATSVLSALGLQKGHFRAPGNGDCLAMFCPLSPTKKLPVYFGIPLD